MGECLLHLGVWLASRSVLSLEPLREHVLLQIYNVHYLLLQVSEAVTQALILISHAVVDLVLLFRDH